MKMDWDQCLIGSINSIHYDSYSIYRICSKFLTGKPKGKRPIRRPRRRWEDNIRMGLKEIGINKRNWVDWAQDRDYWRALGNAIFNLRVS